MNDLCISGGRRHKTEEKEVTKMSQGTSSGSCCWERIFHQLMVKDGQAVSIHPEKMHLLPWALTLISKNSFDFIAYVPTSPIPWPEPSWASHKLILTAALWGRSHSFYFMDEVQREKDQQVRKWERNSNLDLTRKTFPVLFHHENRTARPLPKSAFPLCLQGTMLKKKHFLPSNAFPRKEKNNKHEWSLIVGPRTSFLKRDLLDFD